MKIVFRRNYRHRPLPVFSTYRNFDTQRGSIVCHQMFWGVLRGSDLRREGATMDPFNTYGMDLSQIEGSLETVRDGEYLIVRVQAYTDPRPVELIGASETLMEAEFVANQACKMFQYDSGCIDIYLLKRRPSTGMNIIFDLELMEWVYRE